MELKILNLSDHPLETVSLAAGCCYGKDDFSEKRVEICYMNRHMSVFEHANVTFRASGISRSCSHQLVRHRLASYSQRSQRYTKLTAMDLKDRDWYVTPPYILDDPEIKWDYDRDMEGALINYLGLLDMGVKREDARFLLPEATKTDIVCTMNLREIYHFLDTRLNKRAQWEIRELAKLLFLALFYREDDEDVETSSQWHKLMILWMEENQTNLANMGINYNLTDRDVFL